MVAGAEDIRQARYDLARVSRIVQTTAPDNPVALFRPDILQRSALRFCSGFPGHVSYAVKANPSRHVLKTLVQSGITTFDVASIAEMHAVRDTLPTARLHYHNPVRSPSEIAEAKALGIASWSIDRLSELDKLGDLPPKSQIAVRVTLRRGGAAYDFGAKFGASVDDATEVLRIVAARGLSPALTFHPGTQCTDPSAWTDYIATCADIAKMAGVQLAALNVGGGFPASDSDRSNALTSIFATIKTAMATHFPTDAPTLWCEPGRAMVADALWLLLRIKARSDDRLYLNDGLYGALGEWRDMPVPGRRIVLDPRGAARKGQQAPFTVFGPTCDSLDRMPGLWDLPATTAEGDHLLLTGAGAYSLALVTGFNGYGTADVLDLSDPGKVAGQPGPKG